MSAVVPAGRARGARVHAAMALCLVLATTAWPGVAQAHGDLHEQIEETTARLRADSGNAALWLHRAELYRLHEDWPQAEADYAQAERLAPGLTDIHLGRGQLRAAQGRLADAEHELDAFLHAAPLHRDGLEARARVRARRGNEAGAVDDFGTLIQAVDRPEPEWYIERAQALVRAGDPAGAVASLDSATPTLGLVATIGLFAVDIEASQGHWESALARLDALAANQARQEAWQERRGDLLARAGRKEDARRQWSAARAAIGRLPPVRRNTQAMRVLDARLAAKLGSR